MLTRFGRLLNTHGVLDVIQFGPLLTLQYEQYGPSIVSVAVLSHRLFYPHSSRWTEMSCHTR